MPDNSNKIKMAEQALASHRSKMSSAADKDQVRRSIDATQKRLNDLRASHTPGVFNDRRETRTERSTRLTGRPHAAGGSAHPTAYERERYGD